MQTKTKRLSKFIWIPTGIITILLIAYVIFTFGRPAAVPVKRELFDGVTYQRIVKYLPHPMIAHVLIIDTKAKGVRFMVTPPDDNVEGGTIRAQTTSQFLEKYKVQIAVNGDGFFPWWSHSPLDYYPHVGDPVTPNGVAASYGVVYADGLQDSRPEPVIYITRRGELAFNRAPSRIYDALSGDRMLVVSGDIVPDLNNETLHPRTAIGMNQNGRWIYLVVVDGRQPFYSMGATYEQMATLLKSLGAYNAMCLDGGGSSTMVIQGEKGQPVVLNSPIDNYIPGRERPVANHLGIFLNQ